MPLLPRAIADVDAVAEALRSEGMTVNVLYEGGGVMFTIGAKVLGNANTGPRAATKAIISWAEKEGKS